MGSGAGCDALPRVAFVGVLGGSSDGGRNAAYSAAGAMIQTRLVAALGAAGLPVDHVLALRPVSSFPTGRRILYGEQRGAEIAGVPATLIPFVNLGPLKPFSVAAALVPRLAAWARGARAATGVAPVIVTYNVQNPPGLAAVLAARRGGARAVAVLADVQVPGDGLVADSALRRLEYAVQRRTLPHLDGLIVLTERMSADFAPAVPHILMEGAAPDELIAPGAMPPRGAAHADGAPFSLLYSGGLNELKGIPLLLDAFALLRGEHYRLWITGTGPLQPLVEAAAARDPRIAYHGFTSYERVLELAREAAALVNPHSTTHASARYVFPSKLIEYLATGTPVISTVSTPEVRSEYGDVLVAVDGDTPAALAAAVARVEAMPPAERAALGTRARAHVAAHKSWAAQGARMARFLVDVARGRAAR